MTGTAGFAGEMRARTFESPWLGMETQSPGYEAKAPGPRCRPVHRVFKARQTQQAQVGNTNTWAPG